MKKKSKWLAGSVILFVLILLLTIPFISMLDAQAFTDGYTTTDENALRFEVKQKKASSSTTVKYETVNWYLFKNQLDIYYADSSAWGDEAFRVTTTRVARTDPDSAGIFWDTMEMDAASFVSELEKLYSRSELIDGVTMFASRTLQKVNGSGTKLGGPYYNYTDFSNAASWSSGTLDAVKNGYNIPIYINLSTASFLVRFVEIDEKGNESNISQPEGFSFAGATVGSKNEPAGSEVIYGEKLSLGSASYTGKDYKYKGYQWTSMSGSSVTAGSPGGITVNNTYAPNGTLELTFYFEVQPEPTPPPFTTPVVTKPPTETPTPTPEPTATPAPTSQPTESVYYDYMYTRYFTTDAGHWIGEIADSTTYTVVSGTSATGGGAVSTNAYTKRENSYLVGTDSSGNQWYFIADGTNATYVHPAKYNGYAVESANIKYITELVFPSVITYGSTTYTVTHIGGGTAKYKTEQSEYTDTEDISYYISYGTYEYDYSKEGSSTSNYKSREYEYIYGVLGNGQIYSDAMDSTFYETTGAYDETWYFNCYYVYNTTLKKITIPSTVKEIENYAFYNCRALEAIEGGAGLTTIWPHAFEVAREMAPQLSSTWTVGSRTCYDYIYYNLDYSMTAVTGTMAAWQTSSRLSSEFVFPYLPALTKIYYQAFKNHYNMDNVDLSATVATIGQEAFMGCELENIRIPNAACSIYDAASTKEYYTTLGSKGQVENPTAIHTVPDSTALSYGLKYDGYYTLYCGYPVSYKPNGGTPEEGYEIYSKLNIQYFYPETDKVYGYANYKPYSHDQYSYYSAGYQYCSYLAPDGVLWRLDTLNTTASVVASGTTFTELINVDDVAHYATDSAGNVWFSGQTLDLDVDSGGSWYTLYSDMCGWEKLTLPSGTVEVKYDSLGIFALDGTGIVWWCDPSWTSNQWVKLNPSGPYFVSFTVDTYKGSTTMENNCLMYGVDASGVVWRTYADSSLGFYLYSSLDAGDYSKYTSIKITVSDISYMNGSDGYLACLDAAGDLYLYNGSKSKSFTGYNFVDMEPLGVSTNAVKVKDASGNTYVAWAYRSSSGNLTGKLYKVASSGVDIKQAWCGVMNYTDWTDIGMNSGDSGTTYSEDRIYVWTTDGYLTACSTSTSWKPASVKFSQIEYIYENIYAIAEDGTLWSMGNNKYGQLGNPNHSGSFGYDYSSHNASRYLKQTGTRTYQAVYSDSDEYTLALGTDGSVYFAGNPDYCNIMDGDDPVNEFVPATDQEWPGSVVITRYIMGYDYDTEIAGTLFKRSGYGFTGWNTAANGTGTAYQPGDMVELSSALTLYAQWGAKSKQVIFHPNGGNGYMPAMTFTYSTTSVTLNENTFTRSGYDFTGWNTEADGSGTSVADKATVTVTEDVLHLYAQWNKKTITYTLVYMTYPYGSQSNTAWKTKTLTDAQTETVEGAPYTVSGTYTVGYSLNKPSTMSTAPVMDTLTSANTSTTAPSFDSWELYKQVGSDLVYRGREYIPGATISKLTQTSGEIFYLYPSWGGANASVLLPGASCEGYDFLGWSESSTGTTKVYPVYGEESDEVSVYTPVKNTTLYAVWKPRQYVVNLDGQSADNMSQTSVTMTFDAACPAVTVPTRDQYVFQGYDTGKEGSGTQYYKADGTSEQIWRIHDGSVTVLYAYWVPENLSVRLDDRGATSTNHTEKVQMIKNQSGASIIVPTKTGYTFRGYYTEIKGGGTKYYDTAGTCIKVWTEENVSVLYAYWIQDDVVYPELEEHIEPVPVPEQTEEGGIGASATKGLLYADDYNPLSGAFTDVQPYLAYDVGTVKGAIPGTEQVAFRARMSAWLLGYEFQLRSGIDMVKVYVTVPYRTQYELENEELVISEIQSMTYTFIIPTVWSYWEVVRSGMYYPETVTVTNEALKEKVFEIPVKSGNEFVEPPKYEAISYGAKDQHVFWETYDADGMPMHSITLQEEQYIISTMPNMLPDVEKYLSIICENAAWKDVHQAKVRSDRYVLGDEIILSDEWQQGGCGAALAPERFPQEELELTSYAQTYQSGLELNEKQPNGTYPTTVVITYAGDFDNIGMPSTKEVLMEDINALNIHTPVVCDGFAVSGIEENLLTLQEEYNYFTLGISNTGLHRMSLGYGEKNFTYALSGKSNLAEQDGKLLNQVRFPFDVYVDAGNDNNLTNDLVLLKESWYTIGIEKQRFYVPDTQKSGVYHIEFRSVAVNCPGNQTEIMQVYANTDITKYVATDSLQIEIQGGLSDFVLVDTNDPEAHAELKSGNQALTLKKGYGFTYQLLSFGIPYEENGETVVNSRFFLESKDGTERKEVTLLPEPELSELAWEQSVFSGEGRLPANVTCFADDGTMVQGDCLIVQLEIKIMDKNGIWYTFDNWKNTELAKDALAAGWNYVPGDVIRYNLRESVADDYEIGGIE